MDSGKTRFWEGSYGASHGASAASSSLPLRRIPGARGALRFPLRVGPLQQVLGARTAQMRAAILHHHLAIDVAGGIRNQETREIGQFAMFAGAAERIARGPSLFAAFGPQLAGGALGRKRAGRDRHQANAL